MANLRLVKKAPPAPSAPLRCVIYARVSTEKQAEKYGLVAQLRDCRAKAMQQGYTLIAELVDEAESAKTLDRPALDNLRRLVRDHQVDVVLTRDNDRFSRVAGEHLLFLKELRDYGVRHDYFGYTPDSSKEGVLQESVLAAIAEFERAQIRDRTSRGAREKARRGLMPTGAAAFGYRRDETARGGLAVDQAEAAIVRCIFTWAADGISIRTIAARLDAQGIRPRRGARWSRTSVRTILHGELYLGRGVYNRRDETGPDGVTIRDESEWITYEVTPLISPSLAERARAQLHRNRALLSAPRVRRVFLLAGVLTCGSCGRRMHGDTGNKTPTYRCEGKALPEDERCRFTVPAPAIEARVWARVEAVIRNPDLAASAVKASEAGIAVRHVTAATEHAELTAELEKVTTRRARLLDLFVDGRIQKAELAAREPALKAEIARLMKAVAAAKARVVAGQAEAERQAGLAQACRFLARELDRLDAAGRQKVLQHFFPKRLRVYGDRIEGHVIIDAATQPPEKPGGEVGQLGREFAHLSGPALEHYSLRLSITLGGPPMLADSDVVIPGPEPA